MRTYTPGTSLAVCHGDCAQLPAAVLQRTCADKPCISACDSNPCGEDNLCSAQTASDGISVAITCLCIDGSTGDFCHLSSSSCHMDISNRCCPIDRDLSITGGCCSADMALDTSGLCCPIASLDGCGVCNGNGVLLDSLGRCCPVATTDANWACCLGSQVDTCGTLSHVQRFAGLAHWRLPCFHVFVAGTHCAVLQECVLDKVPCAWQRLSSSSKLTLLPGQHWKIYRPLSQPSESWSRQSARHWESPQRSYRPFRSHCTATPLPGA